MRANLSRDPRIPLAANPLTSPVPPPFTQSTADSGTLALTMLSVERLPDTE